MAQSMTKLHISWKTTAPLTCWERTVGIFFILLPMALPEVQRLLAALEAGSNLATGTGGQTLVAAATGQAMQQGAPLIYTGEECRVRVTWMAEGAAYGLMRGWVIMSIR